jgi:hypothetical protein
MNNPNSALFKLPAKSIREIFTELQKLRERSRTGDLVKVPKMTLLMTSGYSMDCELIQYIPETGDAIALLDNRSGSLDVSYLHVNAIQAMTIHYTPENIHLLSFGKLQPVSTKIPTRLELERRVRSLSEVRNLPITVAWNELPTTDDGFQIVGILIDDLEAILKDLFTDEMGENSVRQNMDCIEIHVLSTATVGIFNRILNISVGFERGEFFGWERVLLRQEIERSI